MRRTTLWVIALVAVVLGASAGAVAVVSASPPDRDLRSLVVLTPAPTPTETPSSPPVPPADESTTGADHDAVDTGSDAGETPDTPRPVPVQPAPPASSRDGTGAGRTPPALPYDDGMYRPSDEYDDGMYRPSDEYDDGMWTPDTGSG